jgi:hypothetical protein
MPLNRVWNQKKKELQGKPEVTSLLDTSLLAIRLMNVSLDIQMSFLATLLCIGAFPTCRAPQECVNNSTFLSTLLESRHHYRVSGMWYRVMIMGHVMNI